ncbi:hypothetical protein HNQ77_004068 [Silvibacterium bohemicum]|uniref:Uncharacterized protein n=1 Tax=Silvibacterium bohemicum TaxID=1577686 RepID=A0A841K689_9BACT|nr:DUF4188 domain-containing protein [Silvibacterium bohemicum]MBB6146098.1 hypothetical protein [Silvibacterium bohemicum]
MAAIHNGRFTVKIEGDFVVFLIGMRINRLLLVHKWLPVSRAMPRMLKELFQHKEMGLLHAHSFFSGRTVMVVQYWRSFEHLHAYAHARDLAHLPAWAEFNRKVGGNGSVGIFHETYLVKEGAYEAVYGNMPTFGLALAGEMVPAIGRMQNAKSRIGKAEE